MNELVYELRRDVARLASENIDSDVFHHPFKGDEKAVYIWGGSAVGEIPNPLRAYADKQRLAKLDAPEFSLGLRLFSKRMIDVLEAIRPFKYRALQTHIFDLELRDWSEKHQGRNPVYADACEDFVVFGLEEDTDCFDFDKSIYKPSRFDPSLPNIIKRKVFKYPELGFPPVFQLRGLSGLYISGEAKIALENSGVENLNLHPVEVSS